MDEFILRRAQKGDTSAFEALVTPYENMIWRVCWHYTHHQEDAQDCAQEAMLKAWRAIGAFRQDCSLESWLYRIAASVCLDHLRKKKRTAAESADALAEEGFDIRDEAPLPDEQAASRERHQVLREGIDALPEDMRTVLILYALEKKKYEEIAEITSSAVGTVKSRLNRARQKLEEYLRQREQSGPDAVQLHERRKLR